MNALKIKGLKLLFCFLLLGLLSCISTQVSQVSPKFPPPPPHHHPPHHHLPPHVKHGIDCLLRTQVLDILKEEHEQPGFRALITKDFKEVYDLVGGASNIESRPRQLISKKTKFYIASLTKQFTAIAILKLVQDGLLKLSDTIQNRLPDFPKKKWTITIEHLLTHTSGLIGQYDYDNDSIPDYNYGISKILLSDTTNLSYGEKVFNYFKDRELISEPGTVFDYSNYGYFLLGLIIEKASSMSYAQYLKENIFDVAHMRDTRVASSQRITDNSLASGYAKDSLGFFVNTDSSIDIFAQISFSAGNIISTVEDLNKWYQYLFSYKIINEDLLKMAHTPYLKNGYNQPKGYVFTPYGYGWVIEGSQEKGDKIIWHNGQIYGFKTSIVFHPSSKTLAILLSNFEHPPKAEYLWYSAIELMSFRIRYYATASLDQIPKKPIRSLRVRTLRDADLQLMKDLIKSSNKELGTFVPMSEILKDIEQ